MQIANERSTGEKNRKNNNQYVPTVTDMMSLHLLLQVQNARQMSVYMGRMKGVHCMLRNAYLQLRCTSALMETLNS